MNKRKFPYGLVFALLITLNCNLIYVNYLGEALNSPAGSVDRFILVFVSLVNSISTGAIWVWLYPRKRDGTT